MSNKSRFVREKVKLGSCFSYIKNGYNVKQGKDKGGIPITRIETLSDNRFNRNKVGYADIFSTEGLENRVLEDGDILMSHINSLPYLGRSVMYRARPDEVFIHGMNLLRLKADRSIVEPAYAELYFRTPHFKQQILKIAKKAVNQASISVSNLKELDFLLMSLHDQGVVIERLSLIITQMEQCERTAKRLDQLVKSRFVEMFGDPISNSKALATKPFIEVVKLQRGFDLPVNERVSTGDIPVFGSNGHLGFHNIAKAEGPGIITGRSGTIGKVDLCNTSYWPLNTSLFSVNTCDNNVVYLRYLVELFDLARFKQGAGVPTLNRNIVHAEQIIDVEIGLQNKFADFATQVDKTRAIAQQQIEKLQLLYDSLAQDYFGD